MVTGVMGEATTTHRAQGDSVDTVILALDDFRACAAWGKCDDDGIQTWRRLLNVAVSRARHRVVLVTGRDLVFDRTLAIEAA